MNIIFSIEFKHDFLKDPLDICLIFFGGGVLQIIWLQSFHKQNYKSLDLEEIFEAI